MKNFGIYDEQIAILQLNAIAPNLKFNSYINGDIPTSKHSFKVIESTGSSYMGPTVTIPTTDAAKDSKTLRKREQRAPIGSREKVSYGQGAASKQGKK